MNRSGERGGLFIATEGGDGAGKGTQTALLVEWLKTIAPDLMATRYPQYDTVSAKPLEMFLRGEFGGINDVHPGVSGPLFTLDRFYHRKEITDVLDRGGVVVSDRYTASNNAHNGAKLKTTEERLEYFERERNNEFNVLQIPKPDHNFFVVTDPVIAQQNVDRKAARSYTDQKRDIHEGDIDHLMATYETYQLLAETYPDEFTLIDSMDASGERMLSPEEIHLKFREPVRNLLQHHGIVTLEN